MQYSLAQSFLATAKRHGQRPAIDVAGEVSYAELALRARSLGATIQRESAAAAHLTAVFAYRSQTAFAGVLGALLAGHGYVPLNRTFPIERTRLMLERLQAVPEHRAVVLRINLLSVPSSARGSTLPETVRALAATGVLLSTVATGNCRASVVDR